VKSRSGILATISSPENGLIEYFEVFEFIFDKDN